MIFLSAQPDDTYFIWQLQVLMQNLKELEVPAENIHILVSYKETINPLWLENRDTIYGTVHYYKDERNTTYYLSSIRPHIIKKFYNEYPELVSEYVFYHDSDILFHSLPFFEGMEDDRVHLSRAGYIDHSYIASKNSRSLITDMINVVGIDESTLIRNQHNTGGAQYYFKGLGYSFWDKVEMDCEQMYIQYLNKIDIYRREFFTNNIIQEAINKDIEISYEEWLLGNTENAKKLSKYDFQIWTTDMWVVLWNMWLLGLESYANPVLDFAWPNTDIKDWGTKYIIFHNSGITSSQDNNVWFYKHDYQHQFPYDKIDHLKPHIKINDDNIIEVIQQVYIDAINKTGELLKKSKVKLNNGLVSIIFITKVESIDYIIRVLDSYIYQDYENKELIILNIKDVSLELPEKYHRKGIRLISSSKSFTNNNNYISFDSAEEDARKLAVGSVVTRWYNSYYEPEYINKFING